MALFALLGLLQHVPQIEEAKYRAKVMHMHSQPPSHLTPLRFVCAALLQQLRRCGFNLQFAAAVIWQIVCRKNKRRRRSSLAPTIQQLRRRRRGGAAGGE